MRVPPRVPEVGAGLLNREQLPRLPRMTAESPASFTCSFCRREIQVIEMRSWSQAISLVAKHVSECDRISETVTSVQTTLAIKEMIGAITKDKQWK